MNGNEQIVKGSSIHNVLFRIPKHWSAQTFPDQQIQNVCIHWNRRISNSYKYTVRSFFIIIFQVYQWGVERNRWTKLGLIVEYMLKNIHRLVFCSSVWIFVLTIYPSITVILGYTYGKFMVLLTFLVFITKALRIFAITYFLVSKRHTKRIFFLCWIHFR